MSFPSSSPVKIWSSRYEDDADEENPIPQASPTKRARCASTASTASAVSSTSYTPYPAQPFDTPTNPFGRKCAQATVRSLPPVTSFAKHIPMRFQFVRKGVSPRMGGVYRIVQVPLNYTFAHLRILVAFLFGSSTASSGLGGQASSRSGRGEEEDYLFEVVSKATMYSPLYKPGQIKSGKTTTKLSNRRDPCRWNVGYGYADDDEDEEEEDELEEDELAPSTALDLEDEVLAELEEKPGEWKWESEEDYVLGHVWPDGLDIRCGIIYHHSATTQVHITVNDKPIPERRGFSNTPYVFQARGRVHLSKPPLPKPKFTAQPSSPSLAYTRSKLTKQNAKSVIPFPIADDAEDEEESEILKPFNASHPFFRDETPSPPCSQDKQASQGIVLVDDSDAEEDDEEPADEDPGLTMEAAQWNEPETTFVKYLKDYLGCPETLVLEEATPAYDPFDDDDDDIPIAPAPQDDGFEEEELETGFEDVEREQEEEEEEDEEEWEDDARSHPTSSPARVLSCSPEPSKASDSGWSTRGLPHGHSTPDLTFSSSSPIPSPHLDTSSLPASPIGGADARRLLFASSPGSSSTPTRPQLEPFDLSLHYPNKKYTFTPAPPAKPVYRRMMARIMKRMERGKDILGKELEELEEKEAKEKEERRRKRAELKRKMEVEAELARKRARWSRDDLDGEDEQDELQDEDAEGDDEEDAQSWCVLEDEVEI